MTIAGGLTMALLCFVRVDGNSYIQTIPLSTFLISGLTYVGMVGVSLGMVLDERHKVATKFEAATEDRRVAFVPDRRVEINAAQGVCRTGLA